MYCCWGGWLPVTESVDIVAFVAVLFAVIVSGLVLELIETARVVDGFGKSFVSSTGLFLFGKPVKARVRGLWASNDACPPFVAAGICRINGF